MTKALLELGRSISPHYPTVSPDSFHGGLRCPSCRSQDYLPLGNNWRRCWICGQRWGRAESEDPGDPPDLAHLQRLLGPSKPTIVSASKRPAVGCELPPGGSQDDAVPAPEPAGRAPQVADRKGDERAELLPVASGAAATRRRSCPVCGELPWARVPGRPGVRRCTGPRGCDALYDATGAILEPAPPQAPAVLGGACQETLASGESLAIDSRHLGGSRFDVESGSETVWQEPLCQKGREVLASLASRGLWVRLGEDGKPRVGPAHLVTEQDRQQLSAHRQAVLAALAAESQSVGSRCPRCAARGTAWGSTVAWLIWRCPDDGTIWTVAKPGAPPPDPPEALPVWPGGDELVCQVVMELAEAYEHLPSPRPPAQVPEEERLWDAIEGAYARQDRQYLVAALQALCECWQVAAQAGRVVEGRFAQAG